MNELIKFKTEIKPILEAIDNLTPWDKQDLLDYLFERDFLMEIFDKKKLNKKKIK